MRPKEIQDSLNELEANIGKGQVIAKAMKDNAANHLREIEWLEEQMARVETLLTESNGIVAAVKKKFPDSQK